MVNPNLPHNLISQIHYPVDILFNGKLFKEREIPEF